ncbi:TPA: DUF935 family protein [Klebsiella oxytoca]|uniref:DUF935 family protein n=1 Tax=Klebsiella oxytoca TaxID=571 RepID=A0AAN5LCM6_KLEOX|nr:DUF935 family protein [Klebsiella oxytoca]
MNIRDTLKGILKKRPVQGQEIATTGDGQDITRPWVGALALPDDSVLMNRGSADLGIYREVLNDEEVKSAFTQRQDAVISRDITVKAGGDRPADIAAAEAMQAQIDALGFDRITRLMHYGVFYGYAVAELIYGTRDNLLWIEEVKVRDRRRFRFTPKGELRLLTPGNMMEGVACPAPYFWSFATGADHDDEPYGLGLAHWLYWPVFFKRNGVKFWLIFLDKYGMPTPVGKYPEGASEEQKRKLLEALRSLSTDTGVIFPEGMGVDLLDVTRSGTADYTALYNAMNEAIRRATVGQISSSGGASKGIGGDESLQEAILTSIAKSDADVICESWNRGPGAWFTAFNFPGAAIPQVCRVFEEPEDLTTLAERDQKVAQTTGYRPTLAQVKDTYGGDWEERPVASTPSPAVPVAEFAGPGAGTDIPALQAQQLNAALMPVMDGWVQQIQDLVNRADSLDALRSGIDALLPELSLDQYADIMAQAMTAAQLAGRYDLMEELHGR